MLPHYYIISHYIELPKKYLELNQTKAIVRVYDLGSNILCSWFTDAHPLHESIIK